MIQALTKEQDRILRSMQVLLPLAADIAQAKISLVVPVTERGEARSLPGPAATDHGEELFLAWYAQAEPLTRLEDVPDTPAGTAFVPIRLSDEPLAVHTLEKGVVTEGMREFMLGQYARLKAYPIFDAAGTCFSAAVFEDREADVVFWDATLDFLRSHVGTDCSGPCYRRMASIDGLVLVDGADCRILAANNAARHIYRVLGVGTLVGQRTNSLEIHWNGVAEVLSTGEAYEEELRRKGLILDLRFLPIGGTGSRPRQLIAIIEDVTQLRQKEEELRVQSAMIKEIHHRVKNNLQTIASLLRLEQRRASEEETKLVLKDAINRISSIALVHEYLSTQGSEEVDMATLGKEVFRTVLSSMGNPELRLKTEWKAAPLRLPSQKAASLSLVLNELVQNSLEHGFEGRRQGTLSVELFETPGNIILWVQDDGVGLPKDFQPGRTKSLGLKIVQTVVQSDLKGVFYLRGRTDGRTGTVSEVLLPRV